jgi:tRNA (uracil-5-)-methyltransferase TRM9
MKLEYRFNAQKIWDTIAESFDVTRKKPWDFCLDFIDILKKTDKVADLGCGNGRHVFPCAERCSHVFGVDISSRLLRIVQKKLQNTSFKNITLIHADVVQLPFTDESLEVILFIASLHNIQGKDHRLMALKEVARVLKPEGSALVSVWSRWQDNFYKQVLKGFIIHPRSAGDIEIYWRQHNLNIPRFYHLYGRGEFLKELQTAGFHINYLKDMIF